MSEPRTFDFNGLRVPNAPKPSTAGGERGGPRQLAVCPFTIVVDSREQLPYAFTGMESGERDGALLTVPTVVRGLASGDYSIDGLEDRVAIERKSLDDLYGSVTWGRGRFENEICRLNWACHKASMELLPAFACVVIEATWPEIVNPLEHRPGWENRTAPRSVEGTIVAWSIRFPRVHWWAAGDRRHGEALTFEILGRFWKEQQGS